MIRLGQRISLGGFIAALGSRELEVLPQVRDRIVAAREIVDAAARGTAPVYGLNTGLGANLGHRIASTDIEAFQRKLVEGRAVAVGPPLAEPAGRAVLLARLIGVAQGHSGMSLAIFDHLCDAWTRGLVPVVPRYGSIGAADLTQNAVWALALLGTGQVRLDDAVLEASDALARVNLKPPPLASKDGLALINHGGLSVALAGIALAETRTALRMMRAAAVLSFQGYGANPGIFASEINNLRHAPGQTEAAAWFLAALGNTKGSRIQDALSFRQLAPMFGAASDAVSRAIQIWEDELNGASDNPVVIGVNAMQSTPNFHAPALMLALEQVSLAMAMLGQGAVMRMQRLMDPDLTGLPRYLSAHGGANAGFVPMQKTAAALLADMRRHAMPASFDPAPVSEGVEDIASHTPLTALKLAEQAQPAQLLSGMEALVACQAIDLRDSVKPPLHNLIRAQVRFQDDDRALGADIDTVCIVLRAFAEQEPDGGE